jgi:hypothetical protein
VGHLRGVVVDQHLSVALAGAVEVQSLEALGEEVVVHHCLALAAAEAPHFRASAEGAVLICSALEEAVECQTSAASVEEEVLHLLEVVGQGGTLMVVVEVVLCVPEAELTPFLVVEAEALKVYLVQVVEVGPVLDLEAAAEPLMAPCCQQRAEAHRTWPLMVSRRHSQVSLVVVVEVEGLDWRHSTMLGLCSVVLEEGLRICQLLQSAVVL